MAIAFRQVATASKGEAGTTITCDVPAGTQNNDGMLLCVTVRGDRTVTTHASWTFVGSALSGTDPYSCRKYVYSRVASSEPSSYTITISGDADATATIVSYSGTLTTGLVDASLGTVDTDADTSLTANAITTTVADCMVVGFFSANVGVPDTYSITPPSGMTERAEIASTGDQHIRSETADVLQAGIGTTGAKTATLSSDPGASDEACFLVALAPAPEAAPSGFPVGAVHI